MQLTASAERTEYVGFVRETSRARSEWPGSTDVAITGPGEYLELSALTHYQATIAGRIRRIDYTVREGDSLWLIAETYETDVSTLISLNPQASSTVIRPGEVLKVAPGFEGLSHAVRRGETLSGIAAAYGLTVKEIETANALTSAERLEDGQLLLLPGARRRQERVMVASRSGDSRRTTPVPAVQKIDLGWVWPITGGIHSSEFGRRWGGFHAGLDIAVATGTSAAATADGTVTFSGWDGGYGYSVIIDHGNGLQTRYAHASKLLVAEGQTVRQGEGVILVGATGNSTGPHLHFEVLLNGTAQNPRLYLP